MGCSQSHSTADDVPVHGGAAKTPDAYDGIMVEQVDKLRALHEAAMVMEKRMQVLIGAGANAGSVQMLQCQLVEVLREAGYKFHTETEERDQIYAGMAVLAASVAPVPPEYG